MGSIEGGCRCVPIGTGDERPDRWDRSRERRSLFTNIVIYKHSRVFLLAFSPVTVVIIYCIVKPKYQDYIRSGCCVSAKCPEVNDQGRLALLQHHRVQVRKGVEKMADQGVGVKRADRGIVEHVKL
ncbi:hypothetical protein QE152_g8780 [Popillia japonica]|uniref:Uncharacterized protein n=1 Tax=Popillia japonica TaxID=7064 RepID=A0AAW1M239_POPJA